MSDVSTLSQLKEGQTALLDEFELAPSIVEHLMNLGFVPGSEVTAAQSGPGGDPRVYRVEGTAIAIRRELSDRIAVRLLPATKLVPSSETVLTLRAEVSAD